MTDSVLIVLLTSNWPHLAQALISYWIILY